MLLGMIFRLYSEIFVEIHALFLEILRFEFVTLFVKHPVKVGGAVTAHSHVLFKFRCLDNRSALTLKPHQKQTYLFRARSFIAKHGVLLVYISRNSLRASRSLVIMQI